MNFFARLLQRRSRPEPFDPQKQLGVDLATTPQCASSVVIVSPKYGMTDYECEVAIPADKLLTWIEHHAKATWSSNQLDQVAKKAMPIWLRGAVLSNETPSYIPVHWARVCEPYAGDFITKGNALVFCPKCENWHSEILQTRVDDPASTPHRPKWSTEWHCKQGHTLHQKRQSLIIN